MFRPIARQRGRFVCLALSFFLLAANVRAGYITGVTATTTMGSGMLTNIINVTNANGLSTPTLTATHGPTLPTNSWVGNDGTLVGTVTFNLGGTFMVDGFAFWNQNDGGPTPTGGSGIQGVTVEYSGDGGTTWTPLPGGPTTFQRVTCMTANPEIFNFAAVSATHFRLNITSNYGDTTSTGFAEIAFNNQATGAAPPPGPPPCVAGTKGVTVTPSGASTDVTEGGATDTYTVVLTAAPSANVTITINAGTQVTTTPTILTFTTANWNTAQTVTVTAVDDAIVEGPHTGTITHTSTSTDTGYNAITITSVTVNITDNDSGPPPPPPPPPPPTTGGEGSYAGPAGAFGSGEGHYGFRAISANMPRRSGHVLLGPCLPRACCNATPVDLSTTRPPQRSEFVAFNISHQTATPTGRSQTDVRPDWARAANQARPAPAQQSLTPAGVATIAVLSLLGALVVVDLARRMASPA